MILARVPEPAASDGTPPPPESRFAMIRRGFWVNVLNPKAIVFFLAFVPQFIRLDQPALPQYMILVGTVIIVDVIIMWGFFATAARPFRALTRTRRGVRVLNAIFGSLFLLVAALLLFVH
jgi:homoserine/homoserine lactone efflux protein